MSQQNSLTAVKTPEENLYQFTSVSSYSACVSMVLINELKEIIDDSLFIASADGSDGSAETVIIELAFLRERTNKDSYHEVINKLIDFNRRYKLHENSNIAFLHTTEYLVLHGSTERDPSIFEKLQTLELNDFNNMDGCLDEINTEQFIERASYAVALSLELEKAIGFRVDTEAGSEHGGHFPITCVINLSDSTMYVNCPIDDNPNWSIVIAFDEDGSNETIYESEKLDINEISNAIKMYIK